LKYRSELTLGRQFYTSAFISAETLSSQLSDDDHKAIGTTLRLDLLASKKDKSVEPGVLDGTCAVTFLATPALRETVQYNSSVLQQYFVALSAQGYSNRQTLEPELIYNSASGSNKLLQRGTD